MSVHTLEPSAYETETMPDSMIPAKSEKPEDVILARIANIEMQHVSENARIFAIYLTVRSGIIDLSRIHTTAPEVLAELVDESYRQAGVHAAAGDVDDDD